MMHFLLRYKMSSSVCQHQYRLTSSKYCWFLPNISLFLCNVGHNKKLNSNIHASGALHGLPLLSTDFAI